MERTNEHYLIAAELQALKLLIDWNEQTRDSFEISMFCSKQSKSFYKAIDTLISNKEAINSNALLREANLIDDSITKSDSDFVLSQEVDLSNLSSTVATLKKASIKYLLLEKAKKFTEELEESSDFVDEEKAVEFIYQSQEILNSDTSRDGTKTLEVAVDEYIVELEERKKGKYYIFGDEFLDNNLTRKAAPGQIILISASSGIGKSTYSLNLVNGMINQNIPTILVSLEMDTISTMDRLLAMRTGIPLTEWYKKGTDMDAVIKKAKEEREALSNKKFRLVDQPNLNLSRIQNIIREFKMTYKVDYVCVYIDLITQVKEFVDVGKTKGTLATTIELGINRLNEIAKSENVCFVCVAQMNRNPDSEKIKSKDQVSRLRPSFNDIKNSNAMGERSRVVIALFRPKFYIQRYLPEDPDLPYMIDKMEAQIVKQNQGQAGIIGAYLFDGDTYQTRPFIEETATISTEKGEHEAEFNY